MEQLDIDYSELYPALKGSTSIMLTNDNNAPAKLIKEFRGRNKIPNIKGAFIEESTYIGEDLVEELVKLKSREELIGEIVGLLQSPIKNVISGLQSSGGQKIAGIVKTLSEKE
jgi:large subunit ribosomal protein L10